MPEVCGRGLRALRPGPGRRPCMKASRQRVRCRSARAGTLAGSCLAALLHCGRNTGMVVCYWRCPYGGCAKEVTVVHTHAHTGEGRALERGVKSRTSRAEGRNTAIRGVRLPGGAKAGNRNESRIGPGVGARGRRTHAAAAARDSRRGLQPSSGRSISASSAARAAARLASSRS